AGFVPIKSQGMPHILRFPYFDGGDGDYGINFGSPESKDSFLEALQAATGLEKFDWLSTYPTAGQESAIYIEPSFFKGGNFLIPTSIDDEHALTKDELAGIEYEHLLDELIDKERTAQTISEHSNVRKFIRAAMLHANETFRDYALKYCLEMLGNSRPQNRATMIVQMGKAIQGGRASVGQFLLNTYVKVRLERRGGIPADLLEKILLARYIQKHNKKFGVKDNFELLEGLLNIVFLENARIYPDNPLKLDTAYRVPPTVIDARASFQQLQGKSATIRAFYNLVCQDGHFSPAKLDRVVEAEVREFFNEIPFEKVTFDRIMRHCRRKSFTDFEQIGFSKGHDMQQQVRALAKIDGLTDIQEINSKLKEFEQETIQKINDFLQQKSADSYQEHPQERPRVGKRKYQSLFLNQAAVNAQAPARQAQIGEPDGEPEPGAPEPGALR
ncbi:hypothetical protein, partial [Piscirickettsia salmonis]